MSAFDDVYKTYLEDEEKKKLKPSQIAAKKNQQDQEAGSTASQNVSTGKTAFDDVFNEYEAGTLPSTLPEIGSAYSTQQQTETTSAPAAEPVKKDNRGLLDKVTDFARGITDKIGITKPKTQEQQKIEDDFRELKTTDYVQYSNMALVPVIQKRIQDIDATIESGKADSAAAIPDVIPIIPEEKITRGIYEWATGNKTVRDQLLKERQYLQELVDGVGVRPTGSTKNVEYKEIQLGTPEEIAQMRYQAVMALKGQSRAANVSAGAVESAAQTVDYVQLLADWTGKTETSKKTGAFSDNLKQWAELIKPENPDLADAVLQGVGSTGPFLVFGSAVGGAASVLSKVNPSVVAWVSAGAGGVLEAMTEAGGTYKQLLSQGEDKTKAIQKANAVLAANIVLNTFLDRFGIQSDEAAGLKKMFLSAPAEGIQEAFQSGIQNVAEGKPFYEGMIESGLIGAIVGFALGAVIPGAQVINFDKVNLSENEENAIKQARQELIGADQGAENDQGEIKPELQALATEASKYESAKDFATIQGTGEDSQIGVLPASKITPRDTVDKTTDSYKELSADIKANGIKEPVIVTVKEDGTVETTEGSHRVTIAQDLGVNVPVIVTKGEIDGLTTISEFYQKSKVEKELAEPDTANKKPEIDTTQAPSQEVTAGVTVVAAEKVQTGLPADFAAKLNRKTPKILELEASITAGDTLPPIPVYEQDGKYITNKDGDNRLIAYQNLGVKEIPVRIEEKTTLAPDVKQKQERELAEKTKPATKKESATEESTKKATKPAKKEKKTTVYKQEAKLSKDDRSAIKKQFTDIVMNFEDQDQAIDQIDALLTLEKAKKNEANYPKRLKAIRAAINGSMYQMLGIDEGSNYKLAYAELQRLKQQPELSELVDNMEQAIADIDAEIAQINPGYKSGLSYNLDASFGEFSDAPIELGGLDDIQPLELPEIVELARSLGVNPIVAALTDVKQGDFLAKGDGRIRIKRSLFAEANIEQASKTLAHEIGHLVDYLPDKTLKRGNLIGRINTLSKFMKRSYGDSEITNIEVKKELIAFSEFWRPYDKETASKSFIKYRESAKELYADALSGLLVSPKSLETQAPIFFKSFFENLDKKPAVQEEYFKLQDFLKQGKDAVLERRLSHIYESYSEAKAKRELIELDKPKELTTKERINKWYHSFLSQHITRFDPIYNKLTSYLKANGISLSPVEELRMQLEEMQLRHNKAYLYLDSVQKDIVTPLETIGLTVDDLGVMLQLERDLGDRKDIANPYGLQGKFAQETLDLFRSKLENRGVNDDQFNMLVQIAQRFRNYNFAKVEEATQFGLYSKKFFEETAKKNKDTYATYQVIDYIHENYVSAGVKKAFGTLKAVENPMISTVLKTLAITEQLEVQKAKLLTVNELTKYFPSEVKKSQAIKGRAGVRVGFKAEKGKEVLKLYNDGKLVGYDVDPAIARAFELYSPQETHNLVKAFSLFNRVFKPLVTTYNVSWGFFSNIKRDASRTYRNLNAILPEYSKGRGVGIGEYLVTWIKAIPESKRFQQSQLTDLTKEMLENSAFSTPFASYDPNANEDNALAPILRKYGFIEKLNSSPDSLWSARLKMLKGILAKPLEAIQFAGSILETTSKISGYQIVKKRVDSARKAGFITRNYIGTPNYAEGGTQKQIDNNVFVFSNVMFQGLRTDLEVAGNPKSRSGFWWNIFLLDVLPKLGMVALASGLFGDKIKEMLAGATEYDKTNYIVIPVGETENGKTAYVRLPQDETARLFGAMAWKIGTAINGQLKKPEQLLSLGVGFIPSPTPLVDIVGAWLSYVQGRNPYDDFRARPVVDDYTWKAGGLPVFEKMVQYTTNSLGLTQFTTYDDASKSNLELVLEKVPVFNRAIKISDYGKTETEREISKDIDKRAAQRILDERAALEKALPKARKATVEERKDIFRKLVEDVYGQQPYDKDTKARITRLSNKFKVGVIDGQVSREMDSLIDANTVEYKIELLKIYKDSMPKEKFDALVIEAYKNKVLSEDTIKEFRRSTK